MSIPNPANDVSVAIVPAAPVLLPQWASLVDPVPQLRSVTHTAVAWLTSRCAEIRVLAATEQEQDIARHLLTGRRLTGQGMGLLVVADGTARRGEKAPGHFDERSAAYDENITRALRDGDLATLRSLDVAQGDELMAAGVRTLIALGDEIHVVTKSQLDLAEAPYGVQYWVARWESRRKGR